MKLNSTQTEKLVRKVISHFKESHAITFQAPEDKIHKRAVAILVEEFQREDDLDREVNKMLDDLERSNPGEFQRYKMFGLLKKKLAKEKGMIL